MNVPGRHAWFYTFLHFKRRFLHLLLPYFLEARFLEARHLRLVPRPPNPAPVPAGIIMAYGFPAMIPDETLPGIPDEMLTFGFFKRGASVLLS